MIKLVILSLSVGGFAYTYENTVSQEDFPPSDEPVVILGKGYSTLYGR